MLSAGMRAFQEEAQVSILQAVRQFEACTADNDPHGEHEFGAV
jgi:hypothetical protein